MGDSRRLQEHGWRLWFLHTANGGFLASVFEYQPLRVCEVY